MLGNKYISIALISMALVSCSFFEKNKSIIIINNQSPNLITDVVVNYTSSIRTDVLGDLPANTSYEYTLKPSNPEDAIYIGYVDNKQKVHFKSVIPSGGKYDQKQYTFNIK